MIQKRIIFIHFTPMSFPFNCTLYYLETIVYNKFGIFNHCTYGFIYLITNSFCSTLTLDFFYINRLLYLTQ